MQNKNNSAKIVTGFLTLALFVLPQLSYADWGVRVGAGYRWHDHPRWGLHLRVLPHGYITVRLGAHRYYYYDGLYYNYAGGDYILVSPPVGAYVTVIPSDFQPVIINGRTYYTDNGVYYILTRHHGYKVVAVPVAAAPVVYAQPQQVIPAQDTFPVNVPNNSGGYTTVILKRSGNGFVGPQGEFYAQFPNIAQLRTMYVR